MKIVEKKYDGYGGCAILITIALLAIAFGCMSCSKTQMIEWNTYDDYELVVDWRSLDTVTLHQRVSWEYKKIYALTDKMKFDTARDMWYTDCNMQDRLQHLYYLKNGKKIQESRWPKEGEKILKQ